MFRAEERSDKCGRPKVVYLGSDFMERNIHQGDWVLKLEHSTGRRFHVVVVVGVSSEAVEILVTEVVDTVEN